MPTRESPRLPGFDYRGCHRYLLTYCTFARARVFTTRDIVALVNAQFLRAAIENSFEVLTYCFMPDHVHLLVEGVGPDADAKAFSAKAKQYSGYRYRARTGGRLWQRDSFDRVLRDTEGTIAVARYILANPVRAGLVDRPLDYPFSGSFAWGERP